MGVLDQVRKRAGRARYTARQGLRTAWYAAHYLAARRTAASFTRPGEPTFKPKSGPMRPGALRRAFFDLYQKDRADIEAGLYPEPRDLGFNQMGRALKASRDFLSDVPEVDKRRLSRNGTDVRDIEGADRFPIYYRQNFHYQTGGWLTEDSAERYDTQVEVLFTGAASAMRRRALSHIAKAIKGKDQRNVRVLDLACGTGEFMRQVLEAFPRLQMTGIDLSPAYSAKARKTLKDWPHVEIAEGQAEAMPFSDDSFDIVVSIYLFHELPPKIRPIVVKEIHRVLKPGGIFIFTDSLQLGDHKDVDAILEYFPEGFHEPYYNSYLEEDFPALFGKAGLEAGELETAFLTKVQTYQA